MKYILLFLYIISFNYSNAQVLNSVEIAKKLENSVVKLEVLDINKNILGTGSGVILSKDRLITNLHCFAQIDTNFDVQIPHSIRINNNVNYDFIYPNKILCVDAVNDYIIFELPKNDYKPCTISKNIKFDIGEEIYTYASPMGYSCLFDRGMINGYKYDTNKNSAPTKNLLVSGLGTHGSSGGGIFNKKGELIGIIKQREISSYQFENINVCIPIDQINLNTYSEFKDFEIKSISLHELARQNENRNMYQFSLFLLYKSYKLNNSNKYLFCDISRVSGKLNDYQNFASYLDSVNIYSAFIDSVYLSKYYYDVAQLYLDNNNIEQSKKYANLSIQYDNNGINYLMYVLISTKITNEIDLNKYLDEFTKLHGKNNFAFDLIKSSYLYIYKDDEKLSRQYGKSGLEKFKLLLDKYTNINSAYLYNEMVNQYNQIYIEK